MPLIPVVDDQADVRAMISMLLRVNHFEVAEAKRRARRVIATWTPGRCSIARRNWLHNVNRNDEGANR